MSIQVQGPVEVKIGDVGTVYWVPTYDTGIELVNFDPSSAPTKQLRFRMPGASGLCVRDATAAQHTVDGVEVWGLQYVVTAADVAPYASVSVGGFHQEMGPIAIEAYLEYSSAQKWTSSTQGKDLHGRPMRVYPTLSV